MRLGGILCVGGLLALTPAFAQNDLGGLAKAIATACPMSAAGEGISARDACADRLGKLKALQAVSNDSLVWGAATKDDYEPSHNKLTRLDGFVWRKLYLSLFAFSGTYAVEHLANGDDLLRLDAGIRPIAPEEFPYPFWHSADKWRDYQQSRQVGLLFRGGKLIAAYRNASLDPDKQFAAKTWDGNWTWEIDGQAGPGWRFTRTRCQRAIRRAPNWKAPIAPSRREAAPISAPHAIIRPIPPGPIRWSSLPIPARR